MSNYNHYKSLYESIKPIRGRAVDVRPLGKRSRDWETIRMDGDVVECVLYKTPVVRYYPDGRIGLQCDSWVTTSTAEFMYEHSPFVCRKRNHKIQVNPTGKYQEDAKYYPLPNHSETVFVLTSDNKYVPSAPLVEHKQVIDRKLAKEAREAVRAVHQVHGDILKNVRRLVDARDTGASWQVGYLPKLFQPRMLRLRVARRQRSACIYRRGPRRGLLAGDVHVPRWVCPQRSSFGEVV
jgi:hypothetical protein